MKMSESCFAIHQPAISEPAGGSKMTVEEVCEKHVTDEHATKMRICRKKEELIDLKLQYCRQKIAHAGEKKFV